MGVVWSLFGSIKRKLASWRKEPTGEVIQKILNKEKEALDLLRASVQEKELAVVVTYRALNETLGLIREAKRKLTMLKKKKIKQGRSEEREKIELYRMRVKNQFDEKVYAKEAYDKTVSHLQRKQIERGKMESIKDMEITYGKDAKAFRKMASRISKEFTIQLDLDEDEDVESDIRLDIARDQADMKGEIRRERSVKKTQNSDSFLRKLEKESEDEEEEEEEEEEENLVEEEEEEEEVKEKSPKRDYDKEEAEAVATLERLMNEPIEEEKKRGADDDDDAGPNTDIQKVEP